MWPFKKKKSDADAVIAVMGEAISFASEKWIYFNTTVAFKNDVPLKEIIAIFLVPVTEGLKNKFVALRNAPDTIFFLIVALGIQKSGTHTKSDIESVFGAQLPEI